MKKIKKINWSAIVMIVLLVTMTWIGANLMNYEWCEEMSGRIWISGELGITLVWSVVQLVKVLENSIDDLKDLTDRIEDLTD